MYVVYTYITNVCVALRYEIFCVKAIQVSHSETNEVLQATTEEEKRDDWVEQHLRVMINDKLDKFYAQIL